MSALVIERHVGVCELCGAEDARWKVATGVSTYAACVSCYRKWNASDQTVEALRELQVPS